jgi:hypothetical protein
MVFGMVNYCSKCGEELEAIYDSELLMEDEPFISPSYYKCLNKGCAKIFLKNSETGEFYEP